MCIVRGVYKMNNRTFTKDAFDLLIVFYFVIIACVIGGVYFA